jgi:hypothetical protein
VPCGDFDRHGHVLPRLAAMIRARPLIPATLDACPVPTLDSPSSQLTLIGDHHFAGKDRPGAVELALGAEEAH